MKEELFALEKASVSCENRPVLTEINMHIYKRSILGIICDNIIEYEAFTAFFPETAQSLPDGCVFCGNLSIPKDEAFVSQLFLHN